MNGEKSNLWPSILAAVITGVFTIVAGFATYWFTTKEPALSYSVTGGPTLPSSAGIKKIYVIEVRNTGKKEITQTLTELRLSNSTVEETATEASPGIKLKDEKQRGSYSVTADMLNPNEYFKVSLLLSTQGAEMNPVVAVRAPGVQAKLISTSDPKKNDKIEFKSILAATIASFISVLVLFTNRILPKVLRSKITQSTPLAPKELVSYICAKCGLLEESDSFRFAASRLTYRGTSDYLMFRGLSSNVNQKEACVAALKAMLLINMHPRSVDAVKRALRTLTGSLYDESKLDEIIKKAIDEGNDPLKLRDKIDELVEQELPAQSEPVCS